MIEPPQRGILSGSKFARDFKDVIKDAPEDFFSHFPAGDKSTVPGAGKKSQERAGGFNWTPYEPMKRSLNWRAGVCGDLKNGRQEHIRGGQYYFNGRIIRTYRKGGILKVGHAIIAHHNGFIEVHVCDVQKCGGEISEKCFQRGFCYQLQRARNSKCDSGLAKECAPIDRNYPGRWYLPCSRNRRSGFEIYPAENALFRLPNGLTCEHCVLQWYWTSANNCNPPGVLEYFQGPDAPRNWGNCAGQGGAVGGFARSQKKCGGREFPEEYYQCADIRITNDAARSGRRDRRRADNRSTPPATSEPNRRTEKRQKSSKSTDPSNGRKRYGNNSGKRAKNGDTRNPLKRIKLYADGKVVRKVRSKDRFNVSKYKRLTFKANTYHHVDELEFYINGKYAWTERSWPYYMFGDSGSKPYYWSSPIMNRRFTLEIRAEGYSLKVSVMLVR